MELDLHIHTRRYSGCSNIDPMAVLKKAKKVGLDGIALTEHGIRWDDYKIQELIEKSKVYDLLVIPGQEVACYTRYGEFQGEFLVFGYPTSLGSNKSVEQVLALVHAECGVVIAAHPFKKLHNGNGDGYYGAGDSIYGLAVDGLEIEHPSYDEESRSLARDAMHAMHIPGIGCSDSHDLSTVGICRTVFERTVNSTESLCEEIRAGRLEAVSLKNQKI
ncbi:MAG: PHP domain-containing protein [Thermodesulfobacteriota bacterium]|nr:PHP domain-containing protein [Thermodesulfobacteriota bacterium]